FEAIKAVKDGTFQGGHAIRFDLKSKGIDYVYDDNNRNLIPDDIHQKVELVRTKIINGEISVPYQ
ncbi:MAG TPA: BMP family ABC transporter substrate-binding protein, partial [Bacteroidota bacterium]|nr:BMP family ABC transporter substrate-binding protein [Bacteroidota bacterium]